MDLQAIATMIGDKVRNWVYFDNLSSQFSRQLQQARSAKTRWETEIIAFLTEKQMDNSVIQVSGARLNIHTEKHTQPLTLTRLEDLLHEYYSKKPPGSNDETHDIIKHIRASRQYTSKRTIKKN
jgi:hypothetical protein